MYKQVLLSKDFTRLGKNRRDSRDSYVSQSIPDCGLVVSPHEQFSITMKMGFPLETSRGSTIHFSTKGWKRFFALSSRPS